MKTESLERSSRVRRENHKRGKEAREFQMLVIGGV